MFRPKPVRSAADHLTGNVADRTGTLPKRRGAPRRARRRPRCSIVFLKRTLDGAASRFTRAKRAIGVASKELLLDLSKIDLNHVVADIEEIRRYNPQRYEME